MNEQAYFEQFSGEGNVAEGIIVSDEVVTIQHKCLKCGNDQARRAHWIDGGATGLEYWICIKCGGMNTFHSEAF